MKTTSIDTNESAVSEIVGIILIVALTIVMAAIIASMALGLAESVQKPRMIAITVDQALDMSRMYVTYRGGFDQASLLSLTINWPDGVTRETITNPKVGDIYVATNGAGPQNMTLGQDHLMVIGHFPHNENQVLLDTLV